MAKIKKRKLRWKPSGSPQVIGYKLYWSEEDGVSYDSPSIDLGNVTEIVLPDDIPEFSAVRGPVELGIAAVDEVGNESDLSVLSAPYQFNAPQAPERFWIETLEEGRSSSLVPVPEATRAMDSEVEAVTGIDPAEDDGGGPAQPSTLEDQSGIKRLSEMIIPGREAHQM
jgi:hypothetical protein